MRVVQDFLDRLGDRSRAFAAVGPVALDLAGVARSRSSVDRVLRVLREGRGDRRIGRLDELQGEALILELRDLAAARGDEPSGALARLVDYDRAHHGNLVADPARPTWRPSATSWRPPARCSSTRTPSDTGSAASPRSVRSTSATPTSGSPRCCSCASCGSSPSRRQSASASYSSSIADLRACSSASASFASSRSGGRGACSASCRSLLLGETACRLPTGGGKRVRASATASS